MAAGSRRADDALVAQALGMIVETCGVEVVGPFAAASMSLAAAAAKGVDAVLLDVDPRDAPLRIADILSRRNVPFILATDVSEALVATSPSGLPIIARPYRANDITAALCSVGLADPRRAAEPATSVQ